MSTATGPASKPVDKPAINVAPADDGIPEVDQTGVTADQVTPIAAWKAAKPLKVPSGNVCLVRPVSLQVFLAQGIIPNSLLPLLLPADNKHGDMQAQKTLDRMGANPEMLREYTSLADAVAVQVLVDPQLEPMPLCKTCGKPASSAGHPVATDDLEKEGKHAYVDPGRDPLKLYVDEVDQIDKAYIFRRQVMGRTEDAEKFRQDKSQGMAAVATGPSVARTTKPASRARAR